MNEIKVLIVEDEPVIAKNIAMYLDNNDFTVSGIAYDDAEARYELAFNTPDAVILDINLESQETGIDIARYIREKFSLPFIFLTSYADKETLEKAKKVEPGGYIVKPFNEKTLLAALEIAISNFANTHNRQAPPLQLARLNRHLLSPLSEREFEVLQQMYNGGTNNQMAAALFVSVNTIKAHIKSAYLKIDANSRASAIMHLRELMTKQP
jgi:DNA-binding NarL/FixJ family response regulator